MHVIRKRYITLIEIMIVMALIAMITGVIAYNYRGSLDEGKKFKTKIAIERVDNILSLELANNPNLDLTNWQQIIKDSPMVKNPDEIINDGWGKELHVGNVNGKLTVYSESYTPASNR